MEDDDEIEWLCAEFGILDPDVEGDGENAALAPRLGDADELGDWE